MQILAHNAIEYVRRQTVHNKLVLWYWNLCNSLSIKMVNYNFSDCLANNVILVIKERYYFLFEYYICLYFELIFLDYLGGHLF